MKGNNPLEYETKCRRCSCMMSWHVGYTSVVTAKNWLRYMHEKILTPIVGHCDSCKKSTVQDIVSFTEYE